MGGIGYEGGIRACNLIESRLTRLARRLFSLKAWTGLSYGGAAGFPDTRLAT
jgi:hypothetical protein